MVILVPKIRTQFIPSIILPSAVTVTIVVQPIMGKISGFITNLNPIFQPIQRPVTKQFADGVNS